MWQRLVGLRRRFLARTLRLDAATGKVRGPDGTVFGDIKTIEWHQQRLRVSGWANLGTVTLVTGASRGNRHVSAEQGEFCFDILWPTASVDAGQEVLISLPGAPQTPIRLRYLRCKRAWMTLVLLMRLVILVPDVLRWFAKQDQGSKARIKARLSLNTEQVSAGHIPDTLFAVSASLPEFSSVTLVVPVYNAADVTALCLERITQNTEIPWQMVVVEDGSTDPKVRPMLRDWVSEQLPGQVTLIEHEVNQGFIASVNAAFSHVLADPDFQSRPVVLVNSDALVPPGWAQRLLAPMVHDPTVASVTPMSNDAEIFSVPGICVRSDLRAGQGVAIDKWAQRLDPIGTAVDAPTGVGFCMAIAPQFLALEPSFDATFGRGYGEEVDWCQKVRNHGGRHLGTAGLFVEHLGGASFGQDDKNRLIARNGQIITRRYPFYDGEVHDFQTLDTLCAPRLALALAWAGTLEPGQAVPIYLAHSLSGGADHWLDDEIARASKKNQPSVVIRVGGAVARWQLEVWGPGGSVTAGASDDLSMIADLLAPLETRRVIYSCGVGDADPISLPEMLRNLCRGPQDRLEVLFHDYFPLSPSVTLLDGDGRYHGPVTPEHLLEMSTQAARAHTCSRTDGNVCTLQDWQAEWGHLLHSADEIRVFSPSSARIVAATYPRLQQRITVAPHSPIIPFEPMSKLSKDAKKVLGVLGNIAPHKGAALVQALAQMPPAQRGGKMVLIGDIDPGYPLSTNCLVHGQYHPKDIADLARLYGVTHWLIPSLWPETYSFSTHEALHTGLPVLAFDIGAQGDAVLRATNGVVLGYDPMSDLVEKATRVVHGFAKKDAHGIGQIE